MQDPGALHKLGTGPAPAAKPARQNNLHFSFLTLLHQKLYLLYELGLAWAVADQHVVDGAGVLVVPPQPDAVLAVQPDRELGPEDEGGEAGQGDGHGAAEADHHHGDEEGEGGGGGGRRVGHGLQGGRVDRGVPTLPLGPARLHHRPALLLAPQPRLELRQLQPEARLQFSLV